MNDSEFPRDFDHKKDGKQCRGGYRELRPAKTFAYGTTRQVEKYIVELELDGTDEVVSYWLGEDRDNKLLSLFKKELAARARLGKTDFEQGELIVITQSAEMRPSRTTGNPMWDYEVGFEFAAPTPTAAELLGVTATVPAQDGDPLEESADGPPVFESEPPVVLAKATAQLSVDDELPI